jgi:hypothetical protein
MFDRKLRSFILLVTIFSLYTCIDPYTPNLAGYGSQMVVEGMITNQLSSYEIKLSRTFQSKSSVPEKISDAIVSITDETGAKTTLSCNGEGSYKTDSSVFRGEVGKTYTLHILTSDGKEYESEPAEMFPVPEIDSLSYKKDVGFANNKSEIHEGISILLDSKERNETSDYLRWEYEETWKFRLPTIPKYKYIDKDTIELIPPWNWKEFCWKQRRSTDIIIRAFSSVETGPIKEFPVNFIGSDVSDRLTIQYSILVKQYSISESEYKFWDNLYKMNENSGDIFGSQPYSVTSNIFNVQDKNENVLGYFEVSAESEKRIDITFKELLELDLPLFHYDCKRITTSPADYCTPPTFGCIPPTWDELYQMWTRSRYNFIEPYYDPLKMTLSKMIFATWECSDCEKTGTAVKPSFWVDR